MRGVRRGEAGGPLHGRLTSAEEDLLRAALVFTGAGLDATLKRLIRDTLPALLESNEQAHRKFEDFAVKQLGGAEAVDGKVLARYIVASNPRERLIEDYIYDLTGSSLQSAEQVDLTAGALGINSGPLRAEINGLRDLFVARNQVSHEAPTFKRSSSRGIGRDDRGQWGRRQRSASAASWSRSRS